MVAAGEQSPLKASEHTLPTPFFLETRNTRSGYIQQRQNLQEYGYLSFYHQFVSHRDSRVLIWG